MEKKEFSREEMKQYVENWKRANEKIDALKREDMQKPDYIQRTLESMEQAFEYVLAHSIVSNYSGLVEWQKFVIHCKKNGIKI